jgi:hypothetical protein
MVIHIPRCVHGGEKTVSHDVMGDVFVFITKDVKFHVSQNQTHVLPPLVMKASRHRINIVPSVDDVVITNPTQVDLVSQSIISCMVVTISSNEGWSLSQSILDGHVFLSNCTGFWMFTPTSG